MAPTCVDLAADGLLQVQTQRARADGPGGGSKPAPSSGTLYPWIPPASRASAYLCACLVVGTLGGRAQPLPGPMHGALPGHPAGCVRSRSSKGLVATARGTCAPAPTIA